MSFCLDDGSELLFGPASMDEPQTAILSEPPRLSGGQVGTEAATRAQIQPTEQTTIQPVADVSNAKGFDKRLLFAPLALVAIVLGGFFGYRYITPAKQIESIAVMPFSNESGNADLEYLSDGMTETLISSLAQLENLSVKPRSSVFIYKGKSVNAATVGKELGVQAVLNGRVAQRGENLSLFVELVDVALDKVVWSQQYNRRQADLVSLQNEIARDLSRRLKPKLLNADEARVNKTFTTDPEAYEHFLKGNYYRRKWTEEGYKKAIKHYDRAIAIDPTYGLAYSGLAYAYLVALDWFLAPTEAVPKARAAALRALELDDSIADAHVVLASIALWYELDWAKCEREITRAIELDPNNAAAYDLYGLYFSALGQHDQAVVKLKKAQSLDPLWFGLGLDLAWVLILDGRVDEGIEQALRMIEPDPRYWFGHLVLALGLERKGRFTEAVDEVKKAYSLNDSTTLAAYTGYMLAAAGRKEEAQAVLGDLLEQSKRKYVPAYYVAAIYSALNEKDKAFEFLEKASEQRTGIVGLKTETLWDNIRPDPRFDAMLKRLNLSE